MRSTLILAAAMLPNIFNAQPALPDGAGDEWEILNQEAMKYYDLRPYDRAGTVAKKGLGVAERVVDPNHQDEAISLNNLASIYKRQGQYELAEPLYRRSLSICEKVFGSNHPTVAIILCNLALSRAFFIWP